MSAANQKNKIVIKPFKPRNAMDQPAAEAIWNSLSRAIAEIHQKNASDLSYEVLYRNAYNLVLHKHGELLYNGVKKSIQTHLAAVAGRTAVSPDDTLLQELSLRWGDHQVTMVMIRDIMMYMDR